MTAAERISALGARMNAQAALVADMKDSLKAAQEDLLRLQRVDMPELLNEYGLTGARLLDGSEVVLAEGVEAKITDENRAAALAWLDEHGYGGIIKTEVTAAFPREEREAALQLASFAAEVAEASIKETVHPATLTAFIKERMAAGEALPLDLFAIVPYQFAKIKPPKP